MKSNLYISGFFEIKLMKKTILDEDLKYIDGKGNLLRSKTELSFSRLLSFLEHDYEYNFKIKLMNGNEVLVDFKVDNKYIEILDSAQDLEKFNEIKKNNPDLDIIGIGKSKFGVKSGDFENPISLESGKPTVNNVVSIFMFLQIIASNVLSIPPEKAMPILSIPFKYSATVANNASIRSELYNTF